MVNAAESASRATQEAYSRRVSNAERSEPRETTSREPSSGGTGTASADRVELSREAVSMTSSENTPRETSPPPQPPQETQKQVIDIIA